MLSVVSPFTQQDLTCGEPEQKFEELNRDVLREGWVKAVMKEAGLDIQHYAADGNFAKKKKNPWIACLCKLIGKFSCSQKEFKKYIGYIARIS